MKKSFEKFKFGYLAILLLAPFLIYSGTTWAVCKSRWDSSEWSYGMCLVRDERGSLLFNEVRVE